MPDSRLKNRDKEIDIDKLAASLTPEQLAKIRMLSAAQGVSAGPRKTTSGTIFEIAIAPDLLEQIEQWTDALAPGMSLTDQVQHWVTEALNAYLYADWRAVEAAKPVVAAPAAPAAAPPAAAVPPTPVTAGT